MHKSQSNILHHLIPPKPISPDPATGYYNPFPNYPFTGSLRPVYPLSEHRTLPKSIPHPTWWQDGNPKYSRSITNRNKIDVLDDKGQQAMRKACKLAREVLDIAAAAAKPGVSTDKIDEIVHQACIERNVSPGIRPLQGNTKSADRAHLVLPFTPELQQLSQVLLHFSQRGHLSRYPRSAPLA
jgi:methionyl aminopeptidase